MVIFRFSKMAVAAILNSENSKFLMVGGLKRVEVLPWAYPSANPKRHLDRFSRFCAAHS